MQIQSKNEGKQSPMRSSIASLQVASSYPHVAFLLLKQKSTR